MVLGEAEMNRSRRTEGRSRGERDWWRGRDCLLESEVILIEWKEVKAVLLSPSSFRIGGGSGGCAGAAELCQAQA